MVSLELNEVEIDYCFKCGSVWLDSGEMEILAETTGEEGSLLDNLRPVDRTREKSLRCPLCGKRMVKAAMGFYENLVLDSCPKGDGFWLNKGELKSVLNAVHQGQGDAAGVLLKNIFLNKNKITEGG